MSIIEKILSNQVIQRFKVIKTTSLVKCFKTILVIVHCLATFTNIELSEIEVFIKCHIPS